MYFLGLLVLAIATIFTPDCQIFQDIVCTQKIFPYLLDSLISCEEIRQKQQKQMSRTPCIFCYLDKAKEEIIYQDNSFIVFRDINPAAKTHWLMIPKEHIGSVKDLKPSDLEVLQEMRILSSKLQEEHGLTNVVLGFHIPPFTSVDHIHLHIIEKPFLNVWRSLKYPSWKGNTWFETLDSAITRFSKL
jgi:diadenosine tetraphosphate (Ap4A) HIT family hydrolase